MLQDIIIAFQSYSEAHRFIVKNKLWTWIIFTGLIYCVLFVIGIYYFWVFSNIWVKEIFTQTGIMAWLDSMKQGWLYLVVIVGQLIIVGVLLSLFFSLFKFLFLIVGSPMFAYLSEKTDSIRSGKDFPFNWKRLFKDAARGVGIALRNVVWQTVYLLSILILSFIPVIGWIAPLIALLIECYYFGFSMLDYSGERNELSASESIEFIGNNKGLAIGNGIVFYLMHLVPVVGWLFAPTYAVVAATLSIEKKKAMQVVTA